MSSSSLRHDLLSLFITPNPPICVGKNLPLRGREEAAPGFGRTSPRGRAGNFSAGICAGRERRVAGVDLPMFDDPVNFPHWEICQSHRQRQQKNQTPLVMDAIAKLGGQLTPHRGCDSAGGRYSSRISSFISLCVPCEVIWIFAKAKLRDIVVTCVEQKESVNHGNNIIVDHSKPASFFSHRCFHKDLSQ